jgi:hypothetical protein
VLFPIDDITHAREAQPVIAADRASEPMTGSRDAVARQHGIRHRQVHTPGMCRGNEHPSIPFHTAAYRMCSCGHLLQPSRNRRMTARSALR